MIARLLLAVLLSTGGSTVSELNRAALRALSENRFEEALELLSQLHQRVPENGRISYNLASALFGTESYAAAESLSAVAENVGADTLSSARAASGLAAAIREGDYAGVRAAADTLRRLLGEGSAVSGYDAANYETALNWLRNHEPPDSEGQGGRSEDSPQPRQEEEQQQTGEEPPSGGEEEAREEPGEDRPAPMPREEMTREMASRILDLVREAAPPDSSGRTKGVVGGGRPW
ncbi:tetratricopeptide repeat protein [Candidatus Fermentibacteria bacterium]|nr:tetratricopeptide repeat protein [Candidatus Fermentibacteria bacterium]